MSKRSVAYIKPDEPSFLRRIKEQVGYKEGPTVDTKRQNAGISDEDLEDTHDELPTVVVLKAGDLTAEEAEEHQKQVELEEAQKPADLEAPIVFKPKKKSAENEEGEPVKKKPKKSETKPKKTLLSFDDEEHDD